MSRRVLACGGRAYFDSVRIWRELDALHEVDPISCLINGGAQGADDAVARWARNRRVPCITEKADWTSHGHAAGAIRNQRMLDEHRPDLVLAFPGGVGTAHMIRIARSADVSLIEIAR